VMSGESSERGRSRPLEESAPNQGATGEPVSAAAERPPPPWEGPVNVGAPINQGAAGAGPEGASAYDVRAEAGGESPLSVESEGDPFVERPELFVGAAFVGGFALAQILKRLGP
jgi:hypothetical protein